MAVVLVRSPSQLEFRPEGDAQMGPVNGVLGGRQWMPLQNRSAGQGSFGYFVGHTDPSERPRLVQVPPMQDAPSTHRPLAAHAFAEHAPPMGTGVWQSPAHPATVPEGHDGQPGGSVGPQLGASDSAPRTATTRVLPARDTRLSMRPRLTGVSMSGNGVQPKSDNSLRKITLRSGTRAESRHLGAIPR